MPHQDQLCSLWRPKTWDEFRDFMIERGYSDVPPADADAKVRFDYIGGMGDITTIRVEDFHQFHWKDYTASRDLPVMVIYATWDGDDNYKVVDPCERGKLWFGVGIGLTGRYYPDILDIEFIPGEDGKIYSEGRQDFFEVDIDAVARINAALSEQLKRPVTLALLCQFY